MTTTLDQLKPNQQGTILEIQDDALATQLVTMGFIIGEEIRLERFAPLRDPILISSGSNHISIRKSDAKKIKVNLV